MNFVYSGVLNSDISIVLKGKKFRLYTYEVINIIFLNRAMFHKQKRKIDYFIFTIDSR